jgi:hypothetical protein
MRPRLLHRGDIGKIQNSIVYFLLQ